MQAYVPSNRKLMDPEVLFRQGSVNLTHFQLILRCIIVYSDIASDAGSSIWLKPGAVGVKIA